MKRYYNGSANLVPMSPHGRLNPDAPKKSPVMLSKPCMERLRTYGLKGDSWETVIIRLMDAADKYADVAHLQQVGQNGR